MAEQCSEQVAEGGRWPRFHQCTRKGVVERDGKWFCKQHDPEEVATKRAAEYEKWQRDFKEEQEQRKYAAAAVAYCERMGLTLEQLKEDVTTNDQ